MAGWLGGWGWLVGKSDINENPVVSLDLDLDFGLRHRVCQKKLLNNFEGKLSIQLGIFLFFLVRNTFMGIFF